MKKISLLFAAMMAFTTLFSCSEHDPAVSPAESLSFSAKSTLVKFDPVNPVYDLTVTATQKSNVDRTISITKLDGIDPVTELPYSTNLEDDFTFSPTVLIPAGEYTGKTVITFNSSNLSLGETRYASFKINDYEGYTLNTTSNLIKVSYTPKCSFNEIGVTIVQDPWGTETTWDIKNASGDIVFSGGPYADLGVNQTFANPTEFTCLQDGTYTFTIYDQYGDGMNYSDNGVTSTGSFKVAKADGTVLVFGLGDSFGPSVTHEFVLP
jgi:hypothetical protein